MSYEAIITKIHLRPHPNADKLMIGTVAGHQVVVSTDTSEGELGIFFPSDGQLADSFCYENNLYREGKGTNKDPEKSGYFESSRRVKTVRLRGAKSDGIWLPLSNLAYTGGDISTLQPGDRLTHFGDQLICEKYYTKATRRAMKNKQKNQKAAFTTDMFKKHFSTSKLRYAINSLPNDATVIITEKLHGTSGRTGHVLFESRHERASLWQKALLSIAYITQYLATGKWIKPTIAEWKHVSGSRNVTFNPYSKVEDGYYSGSIFRDEIHQSVSLKKGETIYYEIVGYTGWDKLADNVNESKLIMGAHNVSSKGDKAHKQLAKRYGSRMEYTYGCELGEYEFYVYRITQTNVDGEITELSWDQIVSRCRELGLKHVPVLGTYTFKNSIISKDKLLNLCDQLGDGPSSLCDKHIKEGVCVRIESPELFDIYKYKSWFFCHLEGIRKNDTDYIDLEEVS